MRDWVMRVVVGVLALVAALVPARGDVAAPAGYERWYVIELQGKPAGWMHELQKTNDAGQVITTSSIEFKIARLDQKMRVAMGSQFVETAAGEPVRQFRANVWYGVAGLFLLSLDLNLNQMSKLLFQWQQPLSFPRESPVKCVSHLLSHWPPDATVSTYRNNQLEHDPTNPHLLVQCAP